MKTTEIDIASLKPYRLNAKTHPQEQIDKLTDWIKRAGFIQPVVIDKNNEIIIGHGRTLAAKQAGLSKVPCVKVDGLNEAEIRSLRLFDNKIADTPFDESLLKQEAIELANLDDFTIDMTGFDEPDFVKNLDKEHPLRLDFDSKQEAEQERADTVPDTAQNQFNVQRGQIWQLGEHRLMCGDSTSESDVSRLMGGQSADMVFTDPPYRMEVEGGSDQPIGRAARKLGEAIKHLCDFDPVKLLAVIPSVFEKQKMNTYIFCNKDLVPDYLNWSLQSGYSFNILFWKKPNAIPLGGSHRPDVEYLLLFRKSGIWNNAVPNVSYSKCLEFGRENSTDHPTMKPVGLIENELLISSNDGSVVVDFFGGSGSTLIACEKTGRKCFMMELDEHYCSVIINRWQEFTGKQATLIKGA